MKDYNAYRNTVDRMISKQIVYASAGFVAGTVIMLALGWTVPMMTLFAIWLIVCLSQVVGVMLSMFFVTLYRSWIEDEKK